jgi:hypothetical protein
MVIEALKAARDFIESDRQVLAESLSVNGEIVFEDDIDRGAMAEYVKVLAVIDEALRIAGRSAPAQVPVAWAGCGECDCAFSCHEGRAACMRNVESECAPPSMTSGERTEYEARIKRLGELLTLQHESGERLAARIMELEEATPPAAQPAQQEPVARIAELEETVRQLNRALREATESPTFMGEPVVAAPAARIKGFDEYGPLLEWNKHWVNFSVGTRLYTNQPAPVPLTERDLASACLSYRHDFGLMDETNRGLLMFQAREWARAFGLSTAAAPEKG